jgi:membrane-bound lytic murein transglycosylase A
LTLSRKEVTRTAARAFFEANFVPHRVVHRGARGMVTGYYEPILKGSLTARRGYATPVLRRPSDLVNLVAETDRAAKARALTHARLMPSGKKVAYPTRQEIEEGALAGQGLEILYLANPVDLFFMQVQGSGRIDLGHGKSVRLTYDGKNGHPYTSVGRYLIDTGLFAAEQVSLQSLETWLKADVERGKKAMWQNKSYVFFRELQQGEDEGPLGAMSIPLTAGRSLAVDTRFHELGLPVWVSAPALTHATKQGGGFHRLMVAQDVGSAIRGPERGDIYFGSGTAAGNKAGVTKHSANFVVLLPKGGLARDEETAGRRSVKPDKTAGQQ